MIQEIYIIEPRIFFGVKTDLIRTYLGFIDPLLQTEKSADVLHIVEKAISLTDKERSRIKQLLAMANNTGNNAV